MYMTLAFLLIALVIYVLFGGADFGGGILEATLWKHPQLRKKLQAKLAPIWEANHVWLIAIVVILFVGFPKVYASLSSYLFVPISLALLGIVLRGSFFTFRKYDPNPQSRQNLYGILFQSSSFLTPICYGLITATLLAPLPVIDKSSIHFYSLFIAPWLSIMGLLCALFVLTLFGYLAAIFFYGELNDPGERAIIESRIKWFFGFVFVGGGLVLTWGAKMGFVDLAEAATPLQIALQLIAFSCIPLMFILRHHIWKLRLLAGIQVTCILTGWFATQFPSFMSFEDGSSLTVQNSSAPEPTLFWLNLALVIVLLLVLPPLVYLYRVFHHSDSVVE